MRSNGFTAGFEKTALSAGSLVTKPAKMLWKGVKTLGGGTFNTIATGIGAGMEGKQGYDKMVAKGSRI